MSTTLGANTFLCLKRTKCSMSEGGVYEPKSRGLLSARTPKPHKAECGRSGGFQLWHCTQWERAQSRAYHTLSTRPVAGGGTDPGEVMAPGIGGILV